MVSTQTLLLKHSYRRQGKEKNRILQEGGAFLPLSCGFQAPTLRLPHSGPADILGTEGFRVASQAPCKRMENGRKPRTEQKRPKNRKLSTARSGEERSKTIFGFSTFFSAIFGPIFPHFWRLLRTLLRTLPHNLLRTFLEARLALRPLNRAPKFRLITSRRKSLEVGSDPPFSSSLLLSSVLVRYGQMKRRHLRKSTAGRPGMPGQTCPFC